MQQLAIGIIVTAAALYSAWRLMPATLRRAFAARIASAARRLGVNSPRSELLATRLANAGGCSECSTCKGCAGTAGRMPKPPRE